jgi:hydroxymethylpyrimidine/phosphomethylpyrimidine kinase
MPHIKRVLSIAGFDPTAWAGVTADLSTFEALGVEGVGAVTALTLQDRERVTGVSAVEARFLSRELSTLAGAFRIDAVKIGMLATRANAAVVARAILKFQLGNVVLDPVIASTGGTALLKNPAAIRLLLPLTTVITPNMEEAAMITGMRVNDLKGMEAAAVRIFKLGPRGVVVTGGHLKGAPVDVYYDGVSFSYFKSKRIKAGAKKLHGTGCIFSSAIAAGLAGGLSVTDSVKGAKRYLGQVIKKRW